MKNWFKNQPATVQASFYALSAAILAACFTLTIRFATEELHPYQAVFLRFLFGLLMIAPVVMRGGFAPLHTKRLPLLGLRGILSASEMCLWFLAVLYLPLAEATTLNFTVPLFGTILAALILRETIRIHRWLAVFVGFIGVGLIIQPGTAAMQPASLLPIAAAICMASAGLITKRLVATESTTALLFYLMLITTPVSLIPALFVWQTPSWHVLGLILFGEVPDIWIFPGGALIIAAAVYVALRERKIA